MRNTLERVASWLLRTAGVLIAIGGLSLLAPAIPLLVIGAAVPLAVQVAALVVQCGLVFIVAGVAVAYLSRPRGARLPNERQPPVSAGRPGLSGWLVIFAPSLVIVPLVLLFLLRPFFAECLRALQILNEAGVWEAAASQMGGLALAPVLLAMGPPAMEVLTALAFVASSLLVLPLLAIRSERLPRVFLACLLIQGALVIGSGLTARSIVQVRAPLENAIKDTDATSPESVEALAWIDRYVTTVQATALTLAWTYVGYLIWAPGLLATRRAWTTFAPAPPPPVGSKPGEPGFDVKAITRPPGRGAG